MMPTEPTEKSAPPPQAAGKPTPTQEELDQIALGEHPDLEPDGSPPDPNAQAAEEQNKKERELREKAKSKSGDKTRQVEPASTQRQGYPTRNVEAQHATTPHQQPQTPHRGGKSE
jgi:hypothetical protein